MADQAEVDFFRRWCMRKPNGKLLLNDLHMTEEDVWKIFDADDDDEFEDDVEWMKEQGYSAVQVEIREVASSPPDYHTAVAMKLFNVAEHEVTPEMRTRAKAASFGALYWGPLDATETKDNPC